MNIRVSSPARLLLLAVLTLLPLNLLNAQLSLKPGTLKEDSGNTEFLLHRNTREAQAEITDDNGNICSLLKLSFEYVTKCDREVLANPHTMEHDLATFVVKIEQKEDGQLWLFLTPGANYLYLKHPEAGKVGFEFTRLGLKLKPQTVYEATVLGDKEWYYKQLDKCDADPGQAIQSGWLILKSEPDGASVYLDGKYVGETPFQQKQRYDSYTYELKKDLYHDTRGTVKVDAPKVERSETLKPAFGSLRITTRPEAGARVSVDGVEQSQTTGCTLERLASGTHKIGVRLDMYQPDTKEVTITDGATTTLNFDLKPRFAWVTISADAGADIYLDGVRKGTGRYSDRLMEGLYELDIRKAHHRFDKVQLEVLAGQDQTLTYTLKPIYGSLDIVSTPMEADVYLDGQPSGQTPLTLDRLLEGEHTVELRKAGYATATQKVSIQEQQSSTVELTLQSGRQVAISTDRSGDAIYVDGQYSGTSPLTAELTYGQHQIKAVRDGKEVSRAVTVPQQGTLPEVKLAFMDGYNGHAYVDLGLPSGLLWATCNVGASSPEEYGSYFAWGETTTKSSYDWSNLKYRTSGDSYSNVKFSKYNTVRKYGPVDNKTVLDLSDDAARANWGGSWRMPTQKEWQELKNNCTWTWTTQNGKNGYKVTSNKNGNSLFLPAAGYRNGSSLDDAGSYGIYWSASLYSSDPYDAWRLDFGSGYVDPSNGNFRYGGRSVRPVTE